MTRGPQGAFKPLAGVVEHDGRPSPQDIPCRAARRRDPVVGLTAPASRLNALRSVDL